MALRFPNPICEVGEIDLAGTHNVRTRVVAAVYNALQNSGHGSGSMSQQEVEDFTRLYVDYHLRLTEGTEPLQKFADKVVGTKVEEANFQQIMLYIDRLIIQATGLQLAKKGAGSGLRSI